MRAMTAVQQFQKLKVQQQKQNATDEPPSKKQKHNGSTSNNTAVVLEQETLPPADPYSIMINKDDDEDDEENTFKKKKEEIQVMTIGAILVQLSAAGLLNAMSGTMGGVVDKVMQPLRPNDAASAEIFKSISPVARALRRTVVTRTEMDLMEQTPQRILEMLVPGMSMDELRNIRRRIYETVVLGKGTHTEEAEDVPVATRMGVHAIERFHKCGVCGNNDQGLFALDRKNGDVICTSCGTVASESLMHEGSQFRKFEGEADRNHHGDVANPLYSSGHGMATTLGGLNVSSNSMMGQKQNIETVLRNAHSFTEMNISQFGRDDRRTRIGYKDRQKRDAFIQMNHVGDALNLHEAVVQRAKELFAGFRDDRELVQQFKGVVAACLCEAFDQLSKDGRQILKRRSDLDEVAVENPKSKRANRRNDLHSASMAGKGGILLDFALVDANKKEQVQQQVQQESVVEHKIASKWELDDCRSFLLEASRSIAKQWFEESGSGNVGEIEGRLVEHTITLCDYLEKELKTRSSASSKTNKAAGRHRMKISTPRVKEMGVLGIKWQHAHERGSGGKGGVGGSGRSVLANKHKLDDNSRTAGQVLILKTAKKLGAIVKDDAAGKAFHAELRLLLAQQEARKQKELRDEAAQQRFRQMKRKPWLQAKAQA